MHMYAYLKLELWVNFDHKYCFWAYSLELTRTDTFDVSPIFVRLSVTLLCYVSPISVRLSVTVLCYVSPISVRPSVYYWYL